MMFGFSMRSSAVSSITTMRSWSGIDWPRMFKSVVFPVPVPPLIRMVLPRSIWAARNSASGRVSVPRAIRSSTVKWRLVNLRMTIAGAGANDRGNHRCQAAPIGELRIEQRVVFVELLAEPVGNDFEAGAQSCRRRTECSRRGGECRRARTTMSSRDCP